MEQSDDRLKRETAVILTFRRFYPDSFISLYIYLY